MDNRATRSNHESEGFHAHLYLSGDSPASHLPKRWEADYHSPKVARVLTKKSRWKIVKTKKVTTPPRLRKPKQLAFDFSINEREFESLAETWRRETAHLPTMIRKAMHPVYQRIIGLGPDAIPLILKELQKRPTGAWFWALSSITGIDPAQSEDTIDGAIQAWLRWGKQQGCI